MKYSFGLSILLATGLLLFAGCSKKETYFYSDGTGSFSPNLKTTKIKTMSDSFAVLKPEMALVESNNAFTEVFTAAMRPEMNVSYEPKLKQVASDNFKLGNPTIKPEKALTNQGVKITTPSKVNGKETNYSVEEVKTVNKIAAVRRLLSLKVVIAFFFTVLILIIPSTVLLLFIPSTSLAAHSIIGGLIVGAIGFILGFVGPMIFSPGANQGPLLGILFTGPLGFLLGLVGGGVYWKTKQ